MVGVFDGLTLQRNKWNRNRKSGKSTVSRRGHVRLPSAFPQLTKFNTLCSYIHLLDSLNPDLGVMGNKKITIVKYSEKLFFKYICIYLDKSYR